MAIPDEAMERVLPAAARPRLGESGALAPEDLRGTGARDAKRALARELVAWLHSDEAAQEAEREFDRVFVRARAAGGDRGGAARERRRRVHLPALIAEEFGISRSEARRLIDAGRACRSASASSAPASTTSTPRVADGEVLRVGRRRFRRLRVA